MQYKKCKNLLHARSVEFTEKERIRIVLGMTSRMSKVEVATTKW